MKPPETEIIVSQPELIDRPVRVVETKYVLPPLNCSRHDIEPDIGGMRLSDYIVWGQEAWNWMSDCSDSIIDAQEYLSNKPTQK